jgi:hypothetical protein
LNYTVKFIVIIGIVGVVSFFAASVLIPEKNAVAPSRKSAAKTSAPPVFRGGGDLQVVVADDKPADKPIKVSDSGPFPRDFESLTPVANAPGGSKPNPIVDTKAAPPAPVIAAAPETKAPPADAKALPPPAAATVPAANTPPADPKAVTLPAKTDTAPAPIISPKLTMTGARIAPANTMAARLDPKAPPVETPPPPPPAAAPKTAAPLVTITATPAAATPPDTAKKKRPDANAPLGYKLASAAVCARVENRAPQGVGDRFSKESGAVYYFTHLVGATDSAAVMHKWYRDGKLIQTSILEIKSPNWRTHSKRSFLTMDDPTGSWKVDVVDQRTGRVLESNSFVITE